ncbi:mannosyltransferase [Rhizina undulata]
MDSFLTFFESYGPLTVLLSLGFSALLLCLPVRHVKDNKVRIVVLVLGDVGRSPRMMYHALSIARKGGQVDLVGYGDTSLPESITSNPNIKFYPLPSLPARFTTSSPLLFPLLAPLKALFQLTSLLYLLLYIIPPSVGYLLLQNPPAIPTLLVARIVGSLRDVRVVVDWHNFAWSILKVKFSEAAPVVAISRWYENFFARGAYANFTVTNAMAKILKEEMGVTTSVKTLYDRPPLQFQPLTPEQRAAFLTKNPVTAPYASAVLSGETRLLLSATSWTPDEDFSILLTALLTYDRVASGKNFLKPGALPSILAVITGKGPMRDAYMARIDALEFQFVTVKSVWLEAEEYPKMVASADLGVSLHTSSSGVDLPMKVVDLFGTGVPVAAVGFEAVGELVKDGENGVVFEHGDQLGEVLERVFDPASKELERLKMGAMRETSSRWDENWDAIAAPVFTL